jgi:hypothetical protein
VRAFSPPSASGRPTAWHGAPLTPVYGLTIATELSNRGLKVAVVARDLPEDEFSTGFCSPWAGCNWCTFEERGDTPAAEWDAITFKYLGRLAQERPDLCRRIPFWDLWNEKKATPWYKGLVFNVSVRARERELAWR